MTDDKIDKVLGSGKLLILDGAMGTMIQSYHLTEDDFRGDRFKDIPGQMQGNNDILVLTRPDVIKDIHRRYLEAGADIITANTFSSQRISMADYHCEHLVEELNREAVRIAKEAVAEYQESHGHSEETLPKYVIATVGPTNKTLSMSPDVSDPSFRAISYDEMFDAYVEQMQVLFDNDVDAILLETIFDTLNCKAGIHAYQVVREKAGKDIPLMLSVTVSDKAGRLLSGQTLEAFLASVQHAPILSVGLNCSFGAEDMISCLRVLAEKAPYFITAHPNAGLPNTLGGYDQTPEMMLSQMRHFVEEGLTNVIGGCCGTTPEHIKALASLKTAEDCKVHVPVPRSSNMWLSGLELTEVNVQEHPIFVNVGERCNVAGSRKFLRLIKEGSYEEALSIARKQVDDGAMVIDVNMDDGLLDAEKEMKHFLNMLACEPDIYRVPVMIDSSNWKVVLQGLKCLQGKCIVNSISLKEGEEVFLSHARDIKMMGAAVVVMAFDESGQADTYERKIAVCERSYRLLVDKVGIAPQDIIFDPNVLSVATGIPEHNYYALDFIRATGWIKKNLPDAHVSGGVSNLSFSFRGNNWIREAMHAVFLFHAQQQGMDFGIVNPSTKVMYSDIPSDKLQVIEDALLRPEQENVDKLISLAQEMAGQPAEVTEKAETESVKKPVEERLIEALTKGNSGNLEADLQEALSKYEYAVKVIEGPLMDGMNNVGRLFGEGKMFLPQVVKAARCMKQAVTILQPYIEQQKVNQTSSAGKVLLATVKGDVHDIGKNIVSVVMACNGYEIIDLGVMVPAEEIVKKTLELKPDIIGLSGLITPSLDEMIKVVRLLKESDISVPVMIGGATTSPLHTALKIAPQYDGSVIWVKDASQNAPLAAKFINPVTRKEAMDTLHKEQQELCEQDSPAEIVSFEEAKKRKPDLF
ncbi:MAG: methionine synthase [Bacteroidaceae bacterium]|nr:methionine synthase [Bacteroidaceae bacterium]